MLTSLQQSSRPGGNAFRLVAVVVGIGVMMSTTLYPAMANEVTCPQGDHMPQKEELAEQGGSPDDRGPAPYCGIYAVYTALQSLGHKVVFADLVSPTYLSSRDGSSMADLVRAVEDFGGYASPTCRMTCSTLSRINRPVVLHARKNFEAREYYHWILFLGMKGNKAIIADGKQSPHSKDMEELSALWDGNALIISDQPIGVSWLLAESLLPILTVGLFALLIGCSAEPLASYCNWEQRTLSSKWGWASLSLTNCVLLLVIAVFIGGVYWLCSPEGFLSCRPAIAAIKDKYLPETLPKITFDEARKAASQPHVTIVDARKLGDLAGLGFSNAIRIPPESSLEQCKQYLSGVDKENYLIIYGRIKGCSSTERVVRSVLAAGYHDVVRLDIQDER